MKKISNIKQLRLEQRKLHAKQQDLELQMGESWRKIKRDLRPQNAMKNLLAEWVGNYMISHFTGKLAATGGKAILRRALRLFS